MRKAGISPFALRIAEEDKKSIPSKGWAEMIRKVYEVDPMVCPQCGGTMKIIAFITEYGAVDRIIDYMKLMFVRFSRRLTSPPSRRYSTDMDRRGDLLSGAAFRRIAEKAISYKTRYAPVDRKAVALSE